MQVWWRAGERASQAWHRIAKWAELPPALRRARGEPSSRWAHSCLQAGQDQHMHCSKAPLQGRGDWGGGDGGEGRSGAGRGLGF